MILFEMLDLIEKKGGPTTVHAGRLTIQDRFEKLSKEDQDKYKKKAYKTAFDMICLQIADTF